MTENLVLKITISPLFFLKKRKTNHPLLFYPPFPLELPRDLKYIWIN